MKRMVKRRLYDMLACVLHVIIRCGLTGFVDNFEG